MLDKAKAIQSEMVEWRRDIHMHPELGFEEHRTAAKVAEMMTGLGYRVRTRVGKTGVVAEIGEGKPVVAIRADMDALPIIDAKDVPYKSRTEGLLHACGHDAHVAIAMGTATLLAREEFAGTVRFLFQPSEEMSDEQGLSGAPRMIEDGAIEGADIVLALHVDSSITTGEIVIDAFSSAGVDTVRARVFGKGGHGAMPHTTVDPIFISGHVILALHGIVSRRLWPFDPAVVTIGSIHGGQAENVVPDEVSLGITMRYLTTEVQEKIHAEIERALGVAKSLGGDYQLDIQKGYPPAYNHPEIVALIKDVVSDLLGPEALGDPRPEMGSEDFGYFARDIPGGMFILGCKIEGDERRHHDPMFDIDEGCLQLGAGVMAEAALRLLKKQE
ncbi:MAG: amidohydrolase [Anaerolineae bacterium]|nr:amidohydrolase [Anaerolineae bacterium]